MKHLGKQLIAATVAIWASFSFVGYQSLFAQEAGRSAPSAAPIAQSTGDNAAPNTPTISPEQAAAQLAVAIKQVNLSLEARIAELVVRHIPAQEFQVIVKVEATEMPASELPYFPGASSVASGSVASDPALKAVNVTVLLSTRFGQETTNALDRILKDKLSDLSGNGLSIKFEPLTVKTEPADSEVKRQLEKIQADLRSATSNSQAVERERNDAKSELVSAKTILETQKANFENQIKSEQEKAKALEDKAKALEESKDTLKNLTQSAVWVLVAILVGICLIFASKLFATAIKAVGTGISTIASSLENLASSLGQKPESNEPEKEKASEEPVAAAAVGGGAGGGGTTATIESLRSRVVDLNNELSVTINESNDNIVIKYLSNLLMHPETVDLAVATMEVLGKEKANQMFYRLGRTYQDQVMQFLNHGHYRKNKIELMVDGGEQLLTRLMGENFKAARGMLTPEMSELLLQLSISDLVDVLNTIDLDQKLRLFFYLEPTRLADVLSLLAKTFPVEMESIASNLHRISEFEKKIDLDSLIVQAMRQRLEANQQDQMEPYFKYYQEVLETMDESLVETFMQKLSQGDERLRKHLKANIVTFNTYFDLPAEFQRELIEGFGNKAIGTLIAGIEPKQGEVILKLVEERRHSLIQEEIDAIQNLPKREIRANFDKVKSTLLTRMKFLAKSGAFADISAQQTDNTPASAAA